MPTCIRPPPCHPPCHRAPARNRPDPHPPLLSRAFLSFVQGDTRDAVNAIYAAAPAAPVMMVGLSAGSGIMVRYLGEEVLLAWV